MVYANTAESRPRFCPVSLSLSMVEVTVASYYGKELITLVKSFVLHAHYHHKLALDV